MSLAAAETKSMGSRDDHCFRVCLLSRGDGSGVTDLDNIKTGGSVPWARRYSGLRAIRMIRYSKIQASSSLNMVGLPPPVRESKTSLLVNSLYALFSTPNVACCFRTSALVLRASS